MGNDLQEALEGELGYKGERGYSTYELAVQNGFEGTLEDYLDHYGVDLSNYVSTDDVVDNLTSDTTNYPLSAKQGKELKTLVDSKANTDDTYNKAQVDAMLENINGKVLWVNPSPTSGFAAQTIQLDLSNYDEVEVFYMINGYTQLDSIKLIKLNYNGNEYKTRTYWNGAMGFNVEFSSNNAIWYAHARSTEWVSNGIQFGTGYTIAHTINTSTGNSSATGSSSNNDARPLFIVGRKRNIYNLS